MRIGLVEFILILFIASITVGPQAALFVDRWMRRADRVRARAARQRAEAQAQMAIEREAMLHRFRVASNVFAALAAVALVYALLFRPIAAPPQIYTPGDVVERTAQTRGADAADALDLKAYEMGDAVRVQDGWVYAAASLPKVGVLQRMQPDGSGRTEILELPGGEITDFDFAPDGTLWLTALEPDGGKLYKVTTDSLGVKMEPVVNQIDGRALACPAAVAVGPDGKVYFTDAAAVSAKYGLASALRTELFAHTASGCVYVYDPAARTVEQVLGGVAGASALALSADGETLYAADLASRCVWAVSTTGRELTAGGKGCAVFAQGLPGYPGALAVEEDGTVDIGYRWARLGWLEDHADGTLLRGAALRLSESMQERLVSLPASAISAERFSSDGALLCPYGGRQLGSVTALCPAGNRIYVGISGAGELRWIRI